MAISSPSIIELSQGLSALFREVDRKSLSYYVYTPGLLPNIASNSAQPFVFLFSFCTTFINQSAFRCQVPGNSNFRLQAALLLLFPARPKNPRTLITPEADLFVSPPSASAVYMIMTSLPPNRMPLIFVFRMLSASKAPGLARCHLRVTVSLLQNM